MRGPGEVPRATHASWPAGGASPRGAGLAWGWKLLLFFLSFFLVLAGMAAVTGVLGAPWGDEEWALWWGMAPTAAAALIASWFFAERVEGIPLAALGLPVDRTTVRSLALGAAVGGFLIAAAVGLLAAAGWLRWAPEPGGMAEVAWALGRITAFLAAAALAEELLFRGYPFQLLARRFGGPAALAVTSVLFGLVHARNPAVGTLGLVNIVLAGLLLGLAYWRTFDLWFAVGVHFGWNWMMGAPVDLPVSGITLEVPGFEPILEGPTAWTGGAFGPEGGLGVTLVSLAGIGWLWRTGRLSRNLAVLALHPLPDRGESGTPPSRPGRGSRGG